VDKVALKIIRKIINKRLERLEYKRLEDNKKKI
jgi:hypothetical protein